MKKYFVVFKQSFSQFTAYRLQIVTQIIQSFLPPLFTVTALTMASPVTQASVKGLLSYYIMIALIYPMTISTIDEDIDELTNNGEINNFLVKPFSLYTWLYIKNLSEKVVVFLTLLPVFVIAVIKFNVDPGKILLIIISLLLSFSLSFTFSYFVGLFCFWIDEFWAVHNVKYVSIQLLGGVVIPYTLFPDNLVSILRYSPFPYLANWTVRIVQNKATFIDIPLILFWLILFLFAVSVVQKKAFSKYSYTAG